MSSLCFSSEKTSPNLARKKAQRIVHYQFQQSPKCVQYACWFSVFALFLCRTCFLPYFSSLLWDSCILLFNNSGLARQNNYFIKLLWFGGKRQLKQHLEQPNMSTRSWRVNRNVLCLSFSKLESRVSIGKRSWILWVCCGFLLMSHYFDFSHSPVLLVCFAFPDRKEISNSSNPGPS